MAALQVVQETRSAMQLSSILKVMVVLVLASTSSNKVVKRKQQKALQARDTKVLLATLRE
jgi:hypothetical protein